MKNMERKKKENEVEKSKERTLLKGSEIYLLAAIPAVTLFASFQLLEVINSAITTLEAGQFPEWAFIGNLFTQLFLKEAYTLNELLEVRSTVYLFMAVAAFSLIGITAYFINHVRNSRSKGVSDFQEEDVNQVFKPGDLDEIIKTLSDSNYDLTSTESDDLSTLVQSNQDNLNLDVL